VQDLVRAVRKGFHQGSVESYLVRYPGGRIHYTIQDHMPGALYILSIVSDVEWNQAYLGEHWNQISVKEYK